MISHSNFACIKCHVHGQWTETWLSITCIITQSNRWWSRERLIVWRNRGLEKEESIRTLRTVEERETYEERQAMYSVVRTWNRRLKISLLLGSEKHICNLIHSSLMYYWEVATIFIPCIYRAWLVAICVERTWKSRLYNVWGYLKTEAGYFLAYYVHQADTGWRLAWFLKIVFMETSVSVCLCVFACVFTCVRISAPKAINN